MGIQLKLVCIDSIENQIEFGMKKNLVTQKVVSVSPPVLLQMKQGKVEVVFNTKTALDTLPALGISSLEHLDGSFLYIAVAVLESTGKNTPNPESTQRLSKLKLLKQF